MEHSSEDMALAVESVKPGILSLRAASKLPPGGLGVPFGTHRRCGREEVALGAYSGPEPVLTRVLESRSVNYIFTMAEVVCSCHLT